MTHDVMPQLIELIDALWPRFAGKFPPEHQTAVLAKLERFGVEEVLGAFRNHRQDSLDAYAPKFDDVVAALGGNSPQTKEWRDEDGRTDAELVIHLKRQHDAGLQVLDEAGEDVVDEAWEGVLAIANGHAEANRCCIPYRDRIRSEGPRLWPVTAAQAVNRYRFDEIMAGC